MQTTNSQGDSQEQRQQERENRARQSKPNHGAAQPAVDKRLDGPNRPSV